MWSCQLNSSSQLITVGQQWVWPSSWSLLFLASPSFTETPVLPLLSELQASPPASLRQDRGRQACYKLVLSPQRLQLITSWGGQQRAVRTRSRTVFLRREHDPAAHTRAAQHRQVPPQHGRALVPRAPGSSAGIPKQHTPALHRHETGYLYFCAPRFLWAKIGHCLGIVERQGETQHYLWWSDRNTATHPVPCYGSFLTLYPHLNNEANAFESSAQIWERM